MIWNRARALDKKEFVRYEREKRWSRRGVARRFAAVVFGCTDAALAASRVNERAAVRGNTAHAPAHFTPPLIDRCPFGPFAPLSFSHPRPRPHPRSHLRTLSFVSFSHPRSHPSLFSLFQFVLPLSCFPPAANPRSSFSVVAAAVAAAATATTTIIVAAFAYVAAKTSEIVLIKILR